VERVIAYVDGFNLYYGLRSKGWKRYYWLNVQDMALGLLKPGQELVATKYFTTIMKQPEDRRRRQAALLEALQTLTDVRIFYGHFLTDEVTCSKCGYTHATHHEKMTDVNISVELLSDAFQDRFDMALLVSADSDLVGVLRAVHRLFVGKRVVVAFPPARSSKSLMQVADSYLHIGRSLLTRSQFPELVTKPNGYVLARPAQWR